MSNRSIVFMFSGQGSQYYQMGKKLYESHPVFRETIEQLNKYAIDQFGEDILGHLYNGQKHQAFTNTRYSHCALFITQYSLARTLMSSNVTPSILLGSSLGEFVCAALSGAVPPNQIIDTLISQAYMLDEHCPSGRMLAILESPEIYYDNPQLFEQADLAGVNFNKHFVVSSTDQVIHRICEALKSLDIVHQVINTSHAFHSKCMDIVANSYQTALQELEYDLPQLNQFSCMTSDYLKELDSRHFWSVIREPIEFERSIQRLERDCNHIYVDLGPSGTLATFTKYLTTNSDSKSLAAMSPFNDELSTVNKTIETLQNHI